MHFQYNILHLHHPSIYSFFFFFLLSVLLKLLKHVKVIVTCELLLENKIEKRTSFLIKRVVEPFDKK